MPVCVLEAYAGRMDAVMALRLLDAAQAAQFPQLERADQKRWHAEQVRRLGSRVGRSPTTDPSARRASLFFLNGRPIGSADLKRNLAGHFGGRLHA